MAKQLVVEEELARSNITIRYVTLRIGESAEDQLLKNVRSSIAEYERSKIALRTSRGRRAKAERGMIVGNGWAPYGYQFARDDNGRIVNFEPDAQTATVVRRIFADLQTMSVGDLCDRLNAEGVPTYFRSARGWQTWMADFDGRQDSRESGLSRDGCLRSARHEQEVASERRVADNRRAVTR